MDDSEVTLNVCLGDEFIGGKLYFQGVRCDRHVDSNIQSEVLKINLLHSLNEPPQISTRAFSYLLACFVLFYFKYNCIDSKLVWSVARSSPHLL